MFFVVYSVMAAWLVVAAVLRIVLSLRSGIPLDVLPAITGGLGLLALTIALPRTLNRIRRRPTQLTSEWIEVPKDLPPTSRT